MSNWRDNIQLASFRGKLFNVDLNTMKFGRRVVLNEYPFKDGPFAEDLGRIGRVFTFTAFIDDRTAGVVTGAGGSTHKQGYFQTRDELIDAIENDSTIGTLVLPTLGKRRVRPSECSVTFSNTVGGMEALELKFVEAGEATFPEADINTVETTQSFAQITTDAVIEEAGKKVDFTPKIPETTEIIQDPDILIDESIEIPNTYVAAIEIALETGEQVAEQVDEFTRILEDYSANLRTNLFEAENFFTDTDSMLVDLRGIWGDEELADAYNSFKDIFDTTVDNIGTIIDLVTPGRDQQDMNNQGIKDGFRNLLIGQMCNITTEEAFESSNQVEARRESLLDSFDQQITNAGENFDLDQRDALVELRSSILDHLDSLTGSLPDEIDLSIADVQPVWVIGNDLYADALRGESIMKENNLINPNFIDGGSVIHVLTS